MSEHFWTFDKGALPPGSGFAMYGPLHLAVLLCVGIACLAVCLLYRRAQPRTRRVMLRSVALLGVALELAKQVALLVLLPAYPIDQLTLHLCGICTVLNAVYAFWPGKTLGEIVYSLALPGALGALLFPDWTAYPPANFFCLQSFIIHGTILCFALMALTSGQLQPSIKNLWRPALFLLAIAAIMLPLNRLLGTNFFFLSSPAPGSPLEFLYNLLGGVGYYFGLAALVAAIWLVMYLPLVLRDGLRAAKARRAQDDGVAF